MRNQNHLEDFRQRVDLYLDNALTFEESQAVESQAKSDPQFERVFNTESSFRNMLKSKIKRSTCSDGLIENIKNRIKL